jgi:hypothetical protein
MPIADYCSGRNQDSVGITGYLPKPGREALWAKLQEQKARQVDRA